MVDKLKKWPKYALVFVAGAYFNHFLGWSHGGSLPQWLNIIGWMAIIVASIFMIYTLIQGELLMREIRKQRKEG